MYNVDSTGLRNVTILDSVALTTTPTRLGTGKRRGVILVANPTSASNVYLKFAPRGGAVPTISATNWHYLVGSEDFSPFLGINEAVDIYASADSATTVNVVEGVY